MTRGTWEEALLLLHRRGWHGEGLEDACARLSGACLEGELAGRPLEQLRPHEIARALGHTLADDEAAALARLCEVHDRVDASGQALRDALADLDAFAQSARKGAGRSAGGLDQSRPRNG
jgi:hypothetical protein